MDNYKTIKELADELGTSKYIVKYQVDKLDKQHIERRNNKIFIDEIGQIHVKNLLNNSPQKTEELFKSTEENYEDKGIFGKEFFAEIEEKNKQIEQLHGMLAAQQKLLDQQQQLTLQANKQIEQLQSQLFLSATDEEIKEETVTREGTEKKIAEQEESLKRWWQFWK